MNLNQEGYSLVYHLNLGGKDFHYYFIRSYSFTFVKIGSVSGGETDEKKSYDDAIF